MARTMSPVVFSQYMCGRCMCVSLCLEQVFDFSSAVHERIQMDANAIEQCEVNVGQRCSFLVSNVPAALQAGSSSTCYKDRKVVVIVKAGITHTAAVHVHRVIEK